MQHFTHLAAAVALLLAGAACRTAAPRPGGTAPLRVLVYNIHAGRDAAGVDNLARVAEVVRASAADVALLQELDIRTERSGRVDQVAELARRTGLHAAFGKSLDYQGGEYGIAILSRWPIVSREVIPLVTDPPPTRAGNSREPRVALRVVVSSPGGPLEVLNSHLDAARDDTWRVQEAARLVEAAREARAAGRRVIAGGDLNSEPGSATQALLSRAGWRDLWTGCGTGRGLTYPASAPVKRIDYLYALSPTATCTSAEVLEGEASDHRALLYVIQPW